VKTKKRIAPKRKRASGVHEVGFIASSNVPFKLRPPPAGKLEKQKKELIASLQKESELPF
jgi:hypothetical protein